MAFVNIHGQPISAADLHLRQLQVRRSLEAKGIVTGRKPTQKNGYAAPPGTGPEGQTCKQCKHKHSFGGASTGQSKTYIKCELRRPTWTNGEGTDILAGSPACSKFEAKE
jgi:hypothetical protein